MAGFDINLQLKLDALWFVMPAGTPDALRAERQQMLLREFQIAARGPMGARQTTPGASIDASHLSQIDIATVANAKLPADFTPDGVADAATLAAIDAWTGANLRAPVIFQGRLHGDPKAAWKVVSEQGFLFHDETVTPHTRVFMLDFTGRYPLDAQGLPPSTPIGSPVVRLAKAGRGAGAGPSKVKGPVCIPPMTQAPFGPKSLTGADWNNLTDEHARSTFRVLMAVAQAEAASNFDGVNGWDGSVISIGPYQYTAFPNLDLGGAELGAFLAYFAHVKSAAYATYFASQGVGAGAPWSKSLFNKSQRVWRGPLGFVNAAGSFVQPPTVSARDWARMWPSFHRVLYALRQSAELKAAFWPYARQRLVDLLTTPWDDGDGPSGAATLGDVFQSECSAALLLRWHVKRPGDVVSDGVAGLVPTQLLTAAGLKGKAIGQWVDRDDAALVSAFAKPPLELLKKRSATLRASLATVTNWSRPQWANAQKGPSLGRTRGFEPFADGIPFPPGS